jgi:hypothetical protein
VALSTSLFDGGLFRRGWLAHHAPVVEAGFRGTVLITEDISRGTYDLDTGLQVGGQSLTYYSGEARVQKIRLPKRSESVLDSLDSQFLRVQIPHGTRLTLPAGAEWKSNLRVEVTACEDSTMVGLLAFTRGWAGSTNSWQTTLTCTFDSRDGEAV